MPAKVIVLVKTVVAAAPVTSVKLNASGVESEAASVVTVKVSCFVPTVIVALRAVLLLADDVIFT